MNNNPIGIIDSGIGGLSVWQEMVKRLLNESTIYLADSKNLPYGEKSEEEVYALAKRLIPFLQTQHVKLIVIACNTITVSALDRLRKDFPDLPIVGTVPVVKTVAIISPTKRIGILSTKRTAESAYQKNLIDQFAKGCEVVNLGTNVLVPMIEQGTIDTEVLKQELTPFTDAKIDTLALGCTHFPFLKKEIQEILGHTVHILDSGEAIARQVQRILTNEELLTAAPIGEYVFYTTGNKETFTKQIARLVGKRSNDTIQEIVL